MELRLVLALFFLSSQWGIRRFLMSTPTNGHMPGMLSTGVEVPVVLGEVIHVVEDEAVPGIILHKERKLKQSCVRPLG